MSRGKRGYKKVVTNIFHLLFHFPSDWSHLHTLLSNFLFTQNWLGVGQEFTAHLLLVYHGDPDPNSLPLMWSRCVVRKLASNKIQEFSVTTMCSRGCYSGWDWLRARPDHLWTSVQWSIAQNFRLTNIRCFSLPVQQFLLNCSVGWCSPPPPILRKFCTSFSRRNQKNAWRFMFN